MSKQRIYALDANVFIQAHRRFYALDFCPGFWDAIAWFQQDDRLQSIDRIRDELEQGRDDLWNWIERKLDQEFFASTDSADVMQWFTQMLAWVQSQTQFTTEAKAEFAGKADGWLVAYAKARGRVVVTLEELNAHVQKRVPIPNVCRAFGVDYVSTFTMLRELNIRLTWQPPG